jgi:predicted transcriptional regulator
VKVIGITMLPLDDLWDKTKEFSWITKEFFYKYFSYRKYAYAYELGGTITLIHL